MFYFLIYQSSITEYYDTEKKFLTSFFWGTISYIFTHALISSSSSPLAIQLKRSFWLILLIDIGVWFYMHQYVRNKDNADSDSSMVDDLLAKISLSASKIDTELEDTKNNKNKKDKVINYSDDNDESEISNEPDEQEPIKNVKQTSKKKKKQTIKEPINKTNDITGSTNIDDLLSDNESTNIDLPETSNMTYSTSLDDLNHSILDDEDSGSDIDIEQFDEFIN